MGVFQTAFTFQKGVLTNSSQLPGQDYISGLVFYGTAPSGFPSSGVKQCFSPQDAINVGINDLHAGETKKTFTYLVTGVGAAGDIVVIKVQEPINPTNTAASPNLVTLCTYTVTAADTTTTLLAASLAAAIMANQASTGGWTATSTTATLTITTRGGLGVFLNSGSPMSVTITGTVAGTLTQTGGATVAGVASVIDTWYYHVSEYFRVNPAGVVWVGVFAIPGTYTFAEVQTLQTAAKGAIRQVGVYADARSIVTNGAADTSALQTICTTLDTNKMPLSAVLAENMAAVSDLTTLINLSLLTYNYVSVNISQDGAAKGWSLFKASGISVTNLGAIMGAISVASVGASIAQPITTYNISDGTENQLPAIANNTLMTAVTVGLQTQLDNYRYIYAGAYVGYTGTYFSSSHTAIISNNNYAYIEQNRVYNKIQRLLYQAYLPYLNSQLTLNADGTLFGPLVISLESVGDNALSVMVSNRELSGIQCVVNPNQNVTTSGRLVVTVYEQNNPIARNIEIDINSVTTLPG